MEEEVGGGPSCLPPSGLLAGQRTPEVGGGGRRRPLLPSSVRTPGWSDMRRAETSQEAGRRRVVGEKGEIRQSWNYLANLVKICLNLLATTISNIRNLENRSWPKVHDECCAVLDDGTWP